MPRPEEITLSADGSPTLRVPAPFAAVATWAVLPCGGVVYWDGVAESLETLDMQGSTVGSFPLLVTVI